MGIYSFFGRNENSIKLSKPRAKTMKKKKGQLYCRDKNYLLMNHFFVHIQSFVGLEFFSTTVAHKNLVAFVFFHGMSG
jgi:hypothetical protein